MAAVAELAADAERLRAALTLSVSIGAAVAVLAGIRRHRPPTPAAWQAIATSMVGFALANAVWLVSGSPTGRSPVGLAIINVAKLGAVVALLLAAVLAASAGVPRASRPRLVTSAGAVGTTWLRRLARPARRVVGGRSAHLVDLGMIASAAALVAAQWITSWDGRGATLSVRGLVETALVVGAAGIIGVAVFALPGVARSATASRVLLVAALLAVVGNLVIAVYGPEAAHVTSITPLLVATGLVGIAAQHPTMVRLGGRWEDPHVPGAGDGADPWTRLDRVDSDDLAASSRVRTALLVVLAVVLLLDPLLEALLVGPTASDLPRSLAVAVLAVAVLVRISTVSAARDQLAAELVDSTRRFHALVQHHAEAIVVVGDDGRVRYASPVTSRVLGQPVSHLAGARLDQVAPVPADDDAVPLMALVEHRIHGAEQSPTRLATKVRRPDGSVCAVEATSVDLRDVPSVAGSVLHLRDVSDRVELEQRLRAQALTDPLTGLPNRVLLRDRLEHALRRAQRSRTAVGVLIVDVDRCKTVNDSFGHAAGDELLITLASRLDTCVRPGDTSARLGGDEFAVLLEPLSDEREAVEVGRRIVRALRTTWDQGGRAVTMTASVGAAVATADSLPLQPQSVLRDADLAMYEAKRGGGDDVRLFRPRMRAAADARLDVHATLAVAIEHGELEVHYQPVVSLTTGRTVGVEALVRWRRGGRLRNASEFVAVAEERDELIAALGETVLRQAGADAARWLRRPGSGIDLHINVSARQLHRPTFLEVVDDVLETHNLPPEHVVLELTETALLDTGAINGALAQLRALGLRLAVDDFGTGYSNLQRLRQSAIDVLKLDRSLVSDVTAGGRDGEAATRLAAAVTQLAAAIGAATVAEGIETEQQRQVLQELGCHHGQGWLFGRPMPLNEIERVLTPG